MERVECQAVVEGKHAFEIGQNGALAGIDVEVKTGGTAVGARAGGDAERIARAPGGEIAVTPHGARERAHVAGEGDVVELQCRMAGGIMQRDAAGEVEPLDGKRGQIEGAARGRRQVDPSFGVETEIHRHAVDGELGGAPFAAHQRAEAELDVELVGAQAAEIVVAAEGDRPQPQCRRRQQPRVQLARHPHRHADDTGRLRLELGPELVPVDEVRPDQRGQQRNDEGNRQSEQRRLHGSPLGQTGNRAKPGRQTLAAEASGAPEQPLI